jgi:type IX secretion system PorP/SprF family membrane protein
VSLFQKYLLLSVTVWCYALHAQDVHFSQYYFSPLSLNPANTGNFKGDYRFFGNYRSQWRDINKAYNTMSVGGDFNFFPRNKQYAAGFVLINDKSGGNLQVNKLLFSLAKHVKWKGNQLHVALQPGVVMKSIDMNANTFPNQLNWNKGQFDNTLPNNEAFTGQVYNYFDLNAGLAWSRKMGKVEPEIGAACFHLTQPNESFYGQNNKLSIRQAYNLALSYSVNPQVILKVHSLYGLTTKTSDWVSGANVVYVLSRDAFFDNSFFAGVMWRSGIGRNADAGIATMGFNVSHYTVGFSYDITFSSLKTAVNSKGGFELAFIYRAKSTRLVKKIIPCERY